jgi:hypothetical protein
MKVWQNIEAVPSPLRGERVRVRGDVFSKARVPAIRTLPLTPALSPDGGEGTGICTVAALVNFVRALSNYDCPP